ncbi:DUF6338 family protein [Mycobacterium sp. E3198]|uniref:DUF6338 family protein n=1 Tax=Mycobacterium sp. E3198 TaxID=1834143 RepID=UPI002101965A|nr:DUF6338 family protein [Mycobacterium sp. E3198]
MPTTLFGFILFICFVTPGFIFLMRRERRHAPRNYSALRETSIIVISSVGFSLPAILALAQLQAWHFPGLPDLDQLAETPEKYALAHLTAVVLMVVSIVAFAVVLAMLCDCVIQLINRDPLVTPNSVWTEVLTGKARRKKSKAVALSIELKNGAAIEGAVKAHGVKNDTNELEWIALRSHPQWPMRSRSPSGQFQSLVSSWSYYMVAGDEIRAATVGYLDQGFPEDKD